ncbi:hypothetical protein MP228_012146 [Amoeboaphelidium protococcarum]|nr:hypothetical protein MP228_012146 [Amoeboaphelidium protococcarum]
MSIRQLSMQISKHREYQSVNEEDYGVNADSESLNKSAFSNFMNKMRKLLPFMWPSGHFWLQMAIFGCVVMLIVQRVLNVIVPLTYKVIVDALTPGSAETIQLPIWPILIHVLVKFLQGNNGLAYTIQSTMWIPVEQYTTKEVSISMFQHLHSLSLKWHLNRKTGEVLRVMDRGTQAIATLLSYIWFNIFPVLVDIAIAVIFFVIQFDVYFGIIVFVTMALYLIVTIQITEWRTKFRRIKNELDNATNSKAVDSLLNFETVKYYGNEDYEVAQYSDRITQYQKADWDNQLSLRYLNLSQNFVITAGLLAGGLLCAKRVADGELNVGDFVLFISYLQQLYGPLNWFGSYYRAINQNFVDMEKMLDLFEEDPEVKDLPGSVELAVTKGHIKFDNVNFSYDSNEVTGIPSLKGISFEVLPGQTVALVGQSGGGKSTILRLLFRFYDVQGGSITIDGQDIRHVTQKSLRKAIGVVPQDTVLFNDTIKYNIRYGNVDAEDELVEKNAAYAQIHDKIASFPERYETKVGERGLRLSGGELQRVAIARTLLKNPPILVFDEATSALDTNTERAIQQVLNDMSQNKTCLVVAHRLSTIVNSDMILVIRDGEIKERGTHEELLAMGETGLYHEMWFKQAEKSHSTRDRSESSNSALI